MKKLVFLFLILIAIAPATKAQINTQTLYAQHSSSLGARYLPSLIGNDFHKVQINLLGGYGYFGNTGITQGKINSLLSADVIDNALLNDVVGDMHEVNHMAFGFDLNTLAATVKINKDNEEFFTLYLGHSERIMGSLHFTKSFFELAAFGNKQWAGQTKNFEFLMNVMHQRELTLGGAATVFDNEIIKIRPGVRFRYITSMANIYTQGGNVSMYTQPQGKYLDFNFDYHYSSAGVDSNNADATIPETVGRGFAIDLGATVQYLDNIKGHISLIDMGAISYDKYVNSYYRSGSYRYQGAEVGIIDPEDDANLQFDSAQNIIDPFESNAAYRTPLGTKLILGGEYGLIEKTGKKEGRKFFKHNFYLTYIQGFSNRYTAVVRPQVVVAYSHNFGTVLNMGASMGLGGYNRFTTGVFLSARLGFLRLGLGSNNLTGLFAPGLATGADFSFNLAMGF